jgi:hypothetical protein
MLQVSFARREAHAEEQWAIVDEPLDVLSERSRVVWGDEEPVSTVGDDLARRAGSGGDCRKPKAHSLKIHNPKTFLG